MTYVGGTGYILVKDKCILHITNHCFALSNFCTGLVFLTLALLMILLASEPS